MKGYLVLEDGRCFAGTSFGAPGEKLGEVVFNTSLTGYQEILTDPSYASQIVTMTYPLIGNYGINPQDVESSRIHLSGFVVKEACKYPSNFTCTQSISQYLIENKIVGIENIDTRALTRHIRLAGAMKAIIWAGEGEPDVTALTAKAKAWVGLENVDTVKNVTSSKQFIFEGTSGRDRDKKTEDRYNIVAYDFGVKFNILRILRQLGCKITVVPASTPAAEVLAMKPDGVFLSNGPGDPAAVTYAVENIRQIVGKVPLFGICLGHQLLSLALGGKTYKLKFGHHGGNHPVKNINTGTIEITAQNHGFCADIDSLKTAGMVMTHLNLNDNTCEGMEHPEKNVFSVQYHPEASPGPHDSGYLFQQFIANIEKTKVL